MLNALKQSNEAMQEVTLGLQILGEAIGVYQEREYVHISNLAEVSRRPKSVSIPQRHYAQQSITQNMGLLRDRILIALPQLENLTNFLERTSVEVEAELSSPQSVNRPEVLRFEETLSEMASWVSGTLWAIRDLRTRMAEWKESFPAFASSDADKLSHALDKARIILNRQQVICNKHAGVVDYSNNSS
jgi:hypothetical protein